MASLIGFLMIIVIVVLLLKGKMSPIVVLAVIPIAKLIQLCKFRDKRSVIVKDGRLRFDGLPGN